MSFECERCDETVSDAFARVLGDNDDRVYGCPNCGVEFPPDHGDDDHDGDDDDDPDPPLIGVGIDDLLQAQAEMEASS